MRALLTLLLALSSATLFAANPIKQLREAADQRNSREVSRIARELHFEYQSQITPEARRAAAPEIAAVMRDSPSWDRINTLINDLDQALTTRAKDQISLRSSQIGMLAMRLEMSDGPAMARAYQTARDQAKANPSFQTFMDVAVRANQAKDYPAAIEAANQALKLAPQDHLASRTAEGTHMVANIAANASLELGNRTDAERYLLSSLDSEGRTWVRLCPDWYVAEKLWKADSKPTVIQYFETAYKLNFPKCQASIATWLADMKADKLPLFAAPPR
jgi:tetratricopeptide (TPR) repeat protein